MPAKPQITAFLNINASGVQESLRAARRSLGGFASDLGKHMKTAAVAGMAGVAAGLAATLKNGFDLKVMEEQTEALMQSMMGGAKEAQKTMDMLAAEQKENPMFSPADLNKAGAALAAFAGKSTDNLQKLVETSQILSTMKPGATLDDAAQALRDAMGGETERLKEFGFTGKELSALKEGGITIKSFMAALNKKGVGQHTLDALGGGVGGQILKMKSEWDSISKQLIEGFWPKIQATAQEFLGWIMANKDQIIEMLTTATEVAIGIIKYTFEFIQGLKMGIATVAQFLGAWWETFSANFSLAKLGEWVMLAANFFIDAAQGTVQAIIAMILGKIKELSPKLFSMFGGEKLMESMQSDSKANFAEANKTRNQLQDETGVTAGRNAGAAQQDANRAAVGYEYEGRKLSQDEWAKIDAAGSGKQQQASLRIDMAGFNGLPKMMGPS